MGGAEPSPVHVQRAYFIKSFPSMLRFASCLRDRIRTPIACAMSSSALDFRSQGRRPSFWKGAALSSSPDSTHASLNTALSVRPTYVARRARCLRACAVALSRARAGDHFKGVEAQRIQD